MKNNTMGNLRTFCRCGVICIAVFLLAAGCAKKKITELSKQELTKDTTWSGDIIINGDIYVPPGITLTITPGTKVQFRRIDEKSDQNLFAVDSPYYPQAEIIIRGRLLARGTKDAKIIFTSVERDARASDWGALNFLGSKGNVIDYAKILCAYNGVHAHGSEVSITNSEFVKNAIGISFKAEEETPSAPWYGRRSNLTITNNLITRNKGGIGFRNSDAKISHNEIVDNKFFGIWPKENVKALITKNEISGNKKGVYLYQTRGVKFINNNIYDNREYNIAMAEAQDYQLDFSNNWFGSINRTKIAKMIFDKNYDPDLTEIKFEPFLRKKVDWRE